MPFATFVTTFVSFVPDLRDLRSDLRGLRASKAGTETEPTLKSTDFETFDIREIELPVRISDPKTQSEVRGHHEVAIDAAVQAEGIARLGFVGDDDILRAHRDGDTGCD